MDRVVHNTPFVAAVDVAAAIAVDVCGHHSLSPETTELDVQHVLFLIVIVTTL